MWLCALALWGIAYTTLAYVPNELYVEEEYGVKYTKLPLTILDATDQGWRWNGACLDGQGRLLASPWGSTFGLWYDNSGYVIGFRATTTAKQGDSKLWQQVETTDQYYVDLFFRDASSACSANRTQSSFLESRGIAGDRLHVPTLKTNLPLARKDAVRRNWVEGDGCFTDIGTHYYHPTLPAYSLATTYNNDGNLTSVMFGLSDKPDAPFEDFSKASKTKEYDERPYTLRVYMSPWQNSCVRVPLYWGDANADLTSFTLEGSQIIGPIFRGKVGNKTSYFLSGNAALRTFYSHPNISREECKGDPNLLSTVWGTTNSSKPPAGVCPYSLSTRLLNGIDFSSRQSAMYNALRDILSDDDIFSALRDKIDDGIQTILRDTIRPWPLSAHIGRVFLIPYIETLFGTSTESYPLILDDLSLHFDAINLPYMEVGNVTERRFEIAQAHNRLYNFLDKVLAAHEKGGKGGKSSNSVVDRYIAQPRLASTSRTDMLVDLYSILSGGEKVKRSLIHVFISVCKVRAVREKIIKELGPERIPETDTLEDMLDNHPYAAKVVEEALRYWNQIQVIRAVTTVPLIITEDAPNPSTYTIPAGAYVYGCLHASNHDNALYSSPEGFFPDRWNEKGRYTTSFSTFGYNDSGISYRTCPGDTLSRQLLQLTLVHMARDWVWDLRYRLETPNTATYPASYLSGPVVVDLFTGLDSGAVVGITVAVTLSIILVISFVACIFNDPDGADDTYATL